jgi:DNA-binding transcriptional regulator YhcF (GntR family)
VELQVDHDGSVPPYEQIRAAFVERIAAGELAPGTKLPTVRALAGALGVAVNTAARAYRELEQDGAIETRGRAGTFVALDGTAAERAAFEDARAFVGRSRRRGLTEQQVRELVDRALRVPDPGGDDQASR